MIPCNDCLFYPAANRCCSNGRGRGGGGGHGAHLERGKTERERERKDIANQPAREGGQERGLFLKEGITHMCSVREGEGPEHSKR